jgi:hypothetical protein
MRGGGGLSSFETRIEVIQVKHGAPINMKVRCAVSDSNLHSRSAIEFHAVAPLEALTCV